MRTSMLVFMLTLSPTLTLPIGAGDEAPPPVVAGRKLVLKKTTDLPIEGQFRIDTKAEIAVSDDQTAVLVDQWNAGNIFISLPPGVARVHPIPVRGWNRPISIPHSTKVVTKTWDYVMVNAPRQAAIHQLAALPHEMEEGDWIDPVVSPRGDILATRPTINELQFWDLKTLKPLSPPHPTARPSLSNQLFVGRQVLSSLCGGPSQHPASENWRDGRGPVPNGAVPILPLFPRDRL